MFEAEGPGTAAPENWEPQRMGAGPLEKAFWEGALRARFGRRERALDQEAGARADDLTWVLPIPPLSLLGGPQAISWANLKCPPHSYEDDMRSSRSWVRGLSVAKS